MKLPVLIFGLCTICASAVADDVKLVERKSCEQIKLEIAALKAIESPSAEEQAELKQLSSQQRANCGVKSNGRRTIPRAQVPTVEHVVVTSIKSDALTEYMNAKKLNCEKLNSEIAKLGSDASSVDIMTEMQRIYDMDCTEKKAPEVAPAPVVEQPSVPQKTDEEWAAAFYANIAACLCGDGTKPNRFGCCTDEIFKDLGNSVFACCPKNMSADDICFPPIKKGGQ